MNHNMSTKFVHSVKVPRLYKECAKIVEKIVVNGASFKSLVCKPNHPNVQGIYALVSETLHHCKELETIIDQSKILVENPRFDPWLAKVLITELLWGKKNLKTEAKPIITILNYKDKLQQALVQNPDAVVDPYGKNEVKLPRYVRVNTLLMSIDEALDAFYNEGWNLLPRCDNYSSHVETISHLSNEDFIQDYHIPEVLIFPPGTKFYDHIGYQKGKILLQDKASCLPAFLLNPKPNSEILDMCAAPGMKTTHLAAIINNVGKIYAVEMNQDRYKTLCDFVTHTDAKCVETIQADALTISPEQYPNVKYILVDPSCSGSGMMNRIEIMQMDKLDLHVRLRKLQSLQAKILCYALLHFPNVQKVVYSTCSIYPEENERVVDHVLSKCGDTFTLVNLKKELKNEWNSFGSLEYSQFGDKCLYALPEKDLCKGFFLAIFKRKKGSQNTDLNQEKHSDNQESCEIAHVKKEIHESYESMSTKNKKRRSNTNEIIVDTSENEVLQNIDKQEMNENGEGAVKRKKSKKDANQMEETCSLNQALEHVTEKTNDNYEDLKKKVKEDKTEVTKEICENVSLENTDEEINNKGDVKMTKHEKRKKDCNGLLVETCENEVQNPSEQIIENSETSVKKHRHKKKKSSKSKDKSINENESEV